MATREMKNIQDSRLYGQRGISLYSSAGSELYKFLDFNEIQEGSIIQPICPITTAYIIAYYDILMWYFLIYLK